MLVITVNSNLLYFGFGYATLKSRVMLVSSKTLGRTNFKVSPIGLGTVEIGRVYGLGPRAVPDEKEAIRLLKRAAELGITFFDTARSYELSEERIRKSGIAKLPNIVISTKCCIVLEKTDDIGPEEIRKQMREEVEESLRTLGMEQLPLLQLHGGSANMIRSGVIQDAAQKLKDEGKVRFVGISVRGEEAPLAAIKDGFFDTLQFAYSILDQRMAGRVFAEAKKHNIGIIGRSVLLKGALTPASRYLVEGLTPLKKNSDQAAKIAEELGTDLPSLAIRFVLSNPNIDTAIIGSGKIKNIESAVSAAEAGPLSQDVLDKLYNLAIDDPMQMDPSKWKFSNQPRDGKGV